MIYNAIRIRNISLLNKLVFSSVLAQADRKIIIGFSTKSYNWIVSNNYDFYPRVYGWMDVYVCVCVRARMCVCARARAHVCVCVR